VQWPCPDPSHPGAEFLYADNFANGQRARLACIDYVPTPETVDGSFPFRLITGRTLYQFNAGTMTGRGRTRELRPGDFLDINPQDAAAAGIASGDTVAVRSRYGATRLQACVTNTVQPGELFATFQDPASMVNRLTSGHGDRITGTPEYKVTAVCVELGDS
jgi:formate dehydrogenase major subunit